MGFFSKILSGIKSLVKSTFLVIKGALTFNFDDIAEGVKVLFRDVIAPVLEPIFNLLGFEDQNIHSIEVITTKLIDGKSKHVVSAIRSSILNSTNLVDEIKQVSITGPVGTARAYLNYGESSFIHGLPDTFVSSYIVNTVAAQSVVESIEGEPVTITQILLRVPKEDDWCKAYLTTGYSYNEVTNTLTISGTNWLYQDCTKNIDTYTINIYREIVTTVDIHKHTIIDTVGSTETTTVFNRTTTTIDNGTPSQLSISIQDSVPTVTTQTGTGSNDGVTIVLLGSTSSSITEYSVLTTEPSTFEEDNLYTIKYYLDSNPSTVKVWVYDPKDNTYPELAIAQEAGDADNLKSLPVVPIRQNFISINSDKETEEYKTSKRILDILGLIKLDDLIEQIEGNPDIELVQDAFLLFGVNLYTDDPNSKLYLYNLFYMLSLIPGYSKEDFDLLPASEKSSAGFFYKVTEQKYNTVITFNYTDFTEITGSIGSVGTVDISFNILPNTTAEELEEDPTTPNSNSDKSRGLINSEVIFLAQIEENTYARLVVNGLFLSTFISVTDSQVNLKVIELVDPDDPNLEKQRANFIIPLADALLSELNTREAEQVIYQSLQLVIYAKQTTHLEWYETPSFLRFLNIIIRIAAIVITILSVGTGAPLSAYLIAIGEQLLIQIALTYAIRKILESGLSDVGKGLAILAIAAGMLGTEGITSLLEVSVDFVDNLLLLVTTVTTFLQLDVEYQTSQLQRQEEESAIERTKALSLLKEAEEFLNEDGILDTTALLNSRVIPILNTWESPSEFIERGLTINMAPVILSQHSNYVSNRLDINNIRPRIFNNEVSLDTDVELV